MAATTGEAITIELEHAHEQLAEDLRKRDESPHPVEVAGRWASDHRGIVFLVGAVIAAVGMAVGFRRRRRREERRRTRFAAAFVPLAMGAAARRLRKSS